MVPKSTVIFWNKGVYTSHDAVIQRDTALDTPTHEYEFQSREASLTKISVLISKRSFYSGCSSVVITELPSVSFLCVS